MEVGLFSSVDTIWTLLGAILVFFMQTGFAMVETGFTRAKNAGNIIMKNVADLAFGSILYWVVGFGIMFGTSNAFFGGFDFFIHGNYDSSIPTMTFVMFQTVFCATAATIVSGAMAERTKFSAYCIYSIVISAIIYPISGHWIWGGGWLAELGFHDFAGSTAVHMVGGLSALIGAKMVGARLGKYTADGKVKAIPGHSLTLGALGVFILWLSWFGFNGASTVSMTGDDTLISASTIIMATNLAASTAVVGVLIITWIRYKKPDVSMTLNGALAGLVAITAGCDAVSLPGAFFIGLCSSVVIVFGVEFIDRVLKIDDPVGAIGVHCLCGALGTILVGFFALDGGLFYGGGFTLLGTQILGVAAVAAWIFVTVGLLFFVIKKTTGIRVSDEAQLAGLDIEEHGLVSSYADFMMMSPSISSLSLNVQPTLPDLTLSAPIEYTASTSHKMTKLVVVTEQSKFPRLKAAMEQIGITGMTVTQVLGYGMQPSKTFYRGASVEANLEPKVQVEIVVCKIPVEVMVDTIKKALFTGKVGDGKIFVYDVENVVKVRTGEEGYDALQDEE
jgi:Amt family ammonium transporter